MSRGNWLQTWTGKQFYPEDPRPEDICIEDIAAGLRIPRFGYQSEEHYCVAQHSVLVAQAVSAELSAMVAPEPVERAGFGHKLGVPDFYEIVLWGLLHDAAEAYLGDMMWPVKQAPEMRGYKELEARCMSAIIKRFGLLPTEPEIVKAMDLRLLATEKRDIMAYSTDRARSAGREAEAAKDRLGTWHSDVVEPLPTIIVPWQPNAARRYFLNFFHQIDGMREKEKAT
jgi:uncharacterized protein